MGKFRDSIIYTLNILDKVKKNSINKKYLKFDSIVSCYYDARQYSFILVSTRYRLIQKRSYIVQFQKFLQEV